jgi:hypothetical protein
LKSSGLRPGTLGDDDLAGFPREGTDGFSASDIARTMGHDFIGAEHLLLGVVGEKAGVGARVLEDLGVSDEAVGRG